MAQTLREIRKEKELTQKQAAEYLKMPLRTYQYYEEDNGRGKDVYIKFLCESLNKYDYVDEDHGLLSPDKIQKICLYVFSHYQVKSAYLFGSYAKGYANEVSDVDLYVDIDLKGIRLLGFIEELRKSLHKKVDLLTKENILRDANMAKEILLDGIKIY